MRQRQGVAGVALPAACPCGQLPIANLGRRVDVNMAHECRLENAVPAPNALFMTLARVRRRRFQAWLHPSALKDNAGPRCTTQAVAQPLPTSRLPDAHEGGWRAAPTEAMERVYLPQTQVRAGCEIDLKRGLDVCGTNFRNSHGLRGSYHIWRGLASPTTIRARPRSANPSSNTTSRTKLAPPLI